MPIIRKEDTGKVVHGLRQRTEERRLSREMTKRIVDVFRAREDGQYVTELEGGKKRG